VETSYEVIQAARDREYQKAWEDAPKSFLNAAGKEGLIANVEAPSRAMEFDNNRSETSYTTSMPDCIDSLIDQLVEKYGTKNEKLVRAIAADMKKPLEREIEQNQALSMGRILFYLVKSETRNIKASVFAALHAIPRLAASNGMQSMRESARSCGVSPEWMRRSRNEVCNVLELPIPTESQKKTEAKIKYSKNGITNHWRHQTSKKEQPICPLKPQQKKITKHPNINKPPSTLLQVIAKHSQSLKPGSRSGRTSASRIGEQD